MNEIKSHEELINMIAKLAQESPTYEKFALYISKNYLDIIFLTAEDVARKAEISQGSVSRFCKDLGYRGYSEFVRSLQGIFRADITAPQRVKYNNTDTGDMTSEILIMEMKNMEMLSEVIAGEAYQQMVDFIAGTEILYLMSARMSATMLPYAGYILNKVRDSVYIATPGTREWTSLHLMNPDKVGVLMYGFPRYPEELVLKAREIHHLGFELQLITDSRLCPMEEYAKNTVQVPITSASIFDIYSTPIALTNILLKDVSRKIPEFEARMKKIEQYEKENHIYYNYKK